MNQNVCPKCQTPNIQNTPFCVNCGQTLAAPQANYGNNPPPAGNAPNYSANQANAPQNPNQPPAAKKSRMGMWLAIIGGVLVLGLVVLGIGAFGLYAYLSANKSKTTSIDINTPTYNRNTTTVNTSTTNTSTVNTTTSTDLSSMTEDEKYRLFYAASKADNRSQTVKVSKKIGIVDEKEQPTAYYKTFIAGMFGWAARDVEFVKKITSKDAAQEYIDSHMPAN